MRPTAGQFWRARRVVQGDAESARYRHRVPRLGRTVARSVNNEQIEFLPAVGGTVSQVDRTELWAIPFEDVAPIRSAPAHKGQRNYTGEWWCVTVERHLAFESWVERDFLITADFDPEVIGLSVQPFTFHFHTRSSQPRSHTPDVFLRFRAGDATVVDVRPDALLDDRSREAFEATHQLCEDVGWNYLRVGDQDPIRAANLRWLAGYRNRHNRNESLAARLLDELHSAGATGIGALAARVGDPVIALPTLYHLMWTHEIMVDVDSAVLDMNVVIQARSQ